MLWIICKGLLFSNFPSVKVADLPFCRTVAKWANMQCENNALKEQVKPALTPTLLYSKVKSARGKSTKLCSELDAYSMLIFKS